MTGETGSQTGKRGNGDERGSRLGAFVALPRDILGIWIEQTEGAKFWLKVFIDLRTRRCQDILIAVTDGLTGMSEARAAVYPATTLQTCIVHLLRHSLDFATWKVRKAVAAALRTIYTAPDAHRAAAALDAFGDRPWGQRYPAIVASWRPPDRTSFRSSRFPRTCGRCSTRRTPWRVCMPDSARC